MNNLIFPSECALLDKKQINGLSSYTQANCQVTLTDDGLRIYRPPNVDGTSSSTTWGGLKLQPFSIDPYILVKGHTYIVMVDVKGKSTNAIANFGWTNQMGWGGGGLNPAPTNVESIGIPANFNGSMTCWYKFTVSDDVYKVCTTSYSSFTAGQTYISYRDFQFGWGYSKTGAEGTDVYLTNLRLYDITHNPTITPNKNGILDLGAMNEGHIIPSFHKSSEINGNHFYEF